MGRVQTLLFVTLLIAFLSITSLIECQTTRFKKSHRQIGVNGEKILHFHHGIGRALGFPFPFWIPRFPGGLWGFPLGWLGGIRGVPRFLGNSRGLQGGAGGFPGGFGRFPGGFRGFPGGLGGLPGGFGGFPGGFGGLPGGFGGFPGGFGGLPGGFGGSPGGFLGREQGYADKPEVKREDELRRNPSP